MKANKCEWENGKLTVCREFNGMVTQGICSSCGADIRKPELQLKVLKSGNTWVMNYKGVDYLATEDNKQSYFIKRRQSLISSSIPKDMWVSFKKLGTLSSPIINYDELNPIMISKSGAIYKFIKRNAWYCIVESMEYCGITVFMDDEGKEEYCDSPEHGLSGGKLMHYVEENLRLATYKELKNIYKKNGENEILMEASKQEDYVI